MILADVNLHIYAYRGDVPEHHAAYAWMSAAVNAPEPFAVTADILTSFLRIVTNPKAFPVASGLEGAFGYIESLLAKPAVVVLSEGPRYWHILREICAASNATSRLIPDARIAAIAVEHGCTVATHDRDFEQFAGLKRFDPLP